MEAFCERFGFTFLAHAVGDANRKGFASYCTSSVGIGGSFPSPCGDDATRELPVVPVFDGAVLSW